MESNKGYICYIMQEFLQQDQLNGPLNLPEHLIPRLQPLVSLEYGNPYPSFLGVITIYRANNLLFSNGFGGPKVWDILLPRYVQK